MTCVSSDCAKAVEPPSLAASGSASDYRQISHDSYDYPNEYVMQVRNGTLGTVEQIEAPADRNAVGAVLHVRLDDGRQLEAGTVSIPPHC